MKLTAADISRMIDLSAVQAGHKDAEIRMLVDTARKYNCVTVYVLPSRIPYARGLLGDHTGILIGGAVGFPSGEVTTRIKVTEARELISLGCGELDMVINVGALLSGRYNDVCDDIRAVVDVAEGIPVKVILECHYLSADQIRVGCDLCIEGGASFVKTGTGWAPTGATLENVSLIKAHVGDAIRIKAAGGVRGLETLLEMYRRGATRFGVGIRSVNEIMERIAALPGGCVEIAPYAIVQ